MRVNRDFEISVTAAEGGIVRRIVLMGIVMGLTCGTAVAQAVAQKEVDRLQNSATVMKEILGMPDNIPKDLLDRAECVIVVPSVKKFAVGVGGSYGRGVMTCRSGQTFDGQWGAPTMIALEGGS